MDIGQKEIDRQIIENTLWDNWSIEDLTKDNYEIINLTKNYKGVNILILKDKDDLKLPYIAVPSIIFTPQVSYQYCKTPKEAEDDTKSKIDQILSNKIKESINFERKGIPIEKMDIGQQEILRQKVAKIDWDWNDPDEKLLKVFEWKPYWIKITEVRRNGKIQYRGTSDCGEPYMDEPDLYDTPEEAEEKIKSWLYDY